MSPPDLSGNTPVADIFQPVQINLVKTLRHKFQVAVFHCFNSRLRQFIHADEPLLLDQGLHGCVAAVMGSYIMRVGNYLYQIALLL